MTTTTTRAVRLQADRAKNARLLMSQAASMRRIAAGLPDIPAQQYRRRAAELELLAFVQDPDMGL